MRPRRTSGAHPLGFMPWFHQVYRTDQRVRLLTCPEDHVYRVLLEEQWAEGSIPSDAEELFRLVWRLGTEVSLEPAYRAAVEKVVAMFFVQAEDFPERLVNPKMCEVAEAAREQQLGNLIRTAKATRARVERRNALLPPQDRQHALTGEQVKANLAAWAGVAAEADWHTKLDALHEAQAELVFAYWQHVHGHPAALYDNKRRSRLYAAVKRNRGNNSVLLFACDGARRDDFLMGREGARRKYDGIETIYRDQEQIERLAELGGYRPGLLHKMAQRYPALVRLADPTRDDEEPPTALAIVQ